MEHNKLSYFVHEIIVHKKDKEESGFSTSIDEEKITAFKETYDKSFTESFEYPLLQNDESENTLEDYFDLNDKKPNVVIVLI